MENFQTQYVAGSFYSGAETNENLDARSKELERFVKNNDLYISALNEMFQDLLILKQCLVLEEIGDTKNYQVFYINPKNI